MYLKLMPQRKETQKVERYHVPLFIVDINDYDTAEWDICIKQTIPHINGIRTVKAIAMACKMDLSIAEDCMQHLASLGVIEIVDIFQYSNIYTLTPKIRNLLDSPSLQEECIEYVISNKDEAKPKIQDIFRLYCRFSERCNVKSLCLGHNLRSYNIDERRFIRFGQVQGLIRRVHEYLVWLSQVVPSGESRRFRSFKRLIDGEHCLDSICCDLGVSHVEVMAWTEENDACVIIKK